MTAATGKAIQAGDILGQSVPLPGIEKELQGLFLDGKDNHGRGVARASLINLAIYNENPSGIAKDNADLDEVTREAACRAILINVDTKAEELGASAWIQAHCQIGGEGEDTVCTEQISFCLSGDSTDLVRNIVFAHLDSDLPLVFWWRGEFSHIFEERLYSRIDRLIFDSESWGQPRDQFLRLAEAQREDSSHMVIHDFAFTRLNPVRRAIANTFDRSRFQGKVSTIKNVTIRFVAGHRMSAVYLCAWFASRTGAVLDQKRSQPDHFAFKGNSSDAPGSFSVSLLSLDEDRKGIVEIDFEVGDRMVKISRCHGREFMRTRIGGPGNQETASGEEDDWLPLGAFSDPMLVIEILNRAGRNRACNAVLPLVGDLLAV